MNNRSAPRALAAATVTLLALGAVACSGEKVTGTDPERVDVVAAFYPLRFVSERVGGDAVVVTDLAKPGVDPHDLELNPRQVGQLSDAELIVYLKGFQPAVDEAVEQTGGDRAFDVTTVAPLLAANAGGHDHDGHDDHDDADGARDPHVWLDPTRLAAIAEQLAQRLGKVDPEHADDYTARAAALGTELTKLDTEFTEGLRTCQRREIVVSHTAFGYLAERYRLEQIGVSGLSPETEPSPRRLAAAIEEARAHGATTIFFESLVSPKVAETIARQVGAKTAVLDPLEALTADEPDADYFSVMRANLANLRTALGCA